MSKLHGKRLTLYQMTKFCTCPDNKINIPRNVKLVLGRIENIVGKGEHADYHHFLPFPQCFQKSSLLGLLKVGIL